MLCRQVAESLHQDNTSKHMLLTKSQNQDNTETSYEIITYLERYILVPNSP